MHQSSTAGDNDAGWSEVVLAAPQRIDLLTLHQRHDRCRWARPQLPAGTYTQMRLVLAPNTGAPRRWPNAIKPDGGCAERR